MNTSKAASGRTVQHSAAANPAQAYRRLLIFRALDLLHAPKPVRLFEIGSGQADLSRELKERLPDIELLGIDLSEMGVELARSKVPDGAFFQQDLARPMALPERYHRWATHAVCSEVLEHLDDPLAALNDGYQAAFLVGAVFAAGAAVLGAVFLRAGAPAPSHEAEAEELIGVPAQAEAE